jgi:hypothetical protein
MRSLFLYSILALASFQSSTVLAQSTAAQRFTTWETILESDITNKTRIWREIEEQSNPVLFPTGKNTLLGILKEGIKSGKIKAYDPTNDRFVKEITVDEIPLSLATRPVVKWYIKEDELQVEGKTETVVRILGLAPVVQIADKNGDPIDRPLLWIYYPDCREYLASFPATTQFSWDEIFNGRHFKARITSFK